MRKLVLVIVLALALPAVAAARPIDRGDGTLAVKSATGRITVTARGGAILGRIDDGQIAITDLSQNGTDEIQVIGADQKPVLRPNGTVLYVGTGMRFRVVGRYSVEVLGRGISLSAVGKGAVQGLGMTDGVFATDGQPFRPMVLPGTLTDVFGQ